jgi:tetratricopeptide (TPR) repeat protein
MRKLYFFIFAALVLIVRPIYAESQAGEANSYYYNEGLKSEKAGEFLNAKVAYQALLLYAKDDNESQTAQKKIVEMDAQLENEKMAALNVKETMVKIGNNSFPKTVVAGLKFRTEYNGDEPFLQNGSSDLARKILLNIKGIELAQNGDIASARKAFQEALDIDSGFAPARENLETIAKI